MVTRSWRCFGRWGRRRRCPARFAASQIDSLDEDAEDDEAVPMVVFDLYEKLSIDDGNDGRGARVRSSGRKMRERERE